MTHPDLSSDFAEIMRLVPLQATHENLGPLESRIRKLVEDRDAAVASWKEAAENHYERAERAEAEVVALRAMLREAGEWLEGIHTGLCADGENQAAHRVFVLIERIDAALAAKGEKE